MRRIHSLLHVYDDAVSCAARTGHGMGREMMEERFDDSQVFNRSDGCSVENRPRLERDNAPDTACVKDSRNACLAEQRRGLLETT